MEFKFSKNWDGFTAGKWSDVAIDVSDFITLNFAQYDGDDTFLAPATQATKNLWAKVVKLNGEEQEKGGVLDMDTDIVSTVTSHGPCYLNKDEEKIVGFQTDKLFKRSLQPFGGIRTASNACKQYGYEISEDIKNIFTKYRKTHNDGVFDVYTDEIKLARKSAIITGLPDAYGRGRIIGDYRRVALYGIDMLVTDKKEQLKTAPFRMTENNIRLREELAEQIRALGEIKEMAQSYGYDISLPASNAQEAIQWIYFGYLATIKEQNGAAMSLGRVSTFLDIYIARDLERGVCTEEQVQEYIDHFVMKLRLVKFARTHEYNTLFSGDPTWVTESIAGMTVDGRHMVTKTSFRFLHTLTNLGPAPEPNLTVLWSSRLPSNFKKYCAKMSIKTSSIQYENDELMRAVHGHDYAIACCVSSMKVGKEMQFFGARANLAKCLLYAINGGVDEKLNMQIGPNYRAITGDYLEYDDVMQKYDDMLEWLAGVYVSALNIIHYMHDKYCYERVQMALHDREVKRYFATGIAGLSVIADSLSAIKHAKVKVLRNEVGLAVDYEVIGDYPKYGNNDDRVDKIAIDIVRKFMEKIRRHHTYRDSIPTMSILTITSNVVYGKKTGSTPDGRKAGVPFAPGANPMHGRDTSGAAASLASVAKLPFEDALDGISDTFSIVPGALGKDDRVFMGDFNIDNLVVQTMDDFNCECANMACKQPNEIIEED